MLGQNTAKLAGMGVAAGLVVIAGCGVAGHECCETGGPGCLDQEIADCVCSQDGYCCETEWDEACVAQMVELECGSCDSNGVASERSEERGEAHACDEPGSAGCSDPEVKACVCEQDRYCCEGEWDETCVAEVAEFGCEEVRARETDDATDEARPFVRYDYAWHEAPRSVAAGDFDGDGLTDLVVANSNGVSIMLGNGDGTFGVPEDRTTEGSPPSVTTADLDEGARLAPVISDEETVSRLGNISCVFSDPFLYGFSDVEHGVATGDLDGDSHLDVVETNLDGVSILFGNGDGTLAEAEEYDLIDTLDFVAVGDFNGDGLLDLAVATLDGMALLLGAGDGSFVDPERYRIRLAVPPLGTAADLDGDGMTDLALVNRARDGIVILHGDEEGTFTGPTECRTGAGPSAIAVGDLDDDGRPDLAVANALGDSITVLLNRIRR